MKWRNAIIKPLKLASDNVIFTNRKSQLPVEENTALVEKDRKGKNNEVDFLKKKLAESQRLLAIEKKKKIARKNNAVDVTEVSNPDTDTPSGFRGN